MPSSPGNESKIPADRRCDKPPNTSTVRERRTNERVENRCTGTLDRREPFPIGFPPGAGKQRAAVAGGPRTRVSTCPDTPRLNLITASAPPAFFVISISDGRSLPSPPTVARLTVAGDFSRKRFPADEERGERLVSTVPPIENLRPISFYQAFRARFTRGFRIDSGELRSHFRYFFFADGQRCGRESLRSRIGGFRTVFEVSKFVYLPVEGLECSMKSPCAKRESKSTTRR